MALCIYWTSGPYSYSRTPPAARSNLTSVEREVDWKPSGSGSRQAHCSAIQRSGPGTQARPDDGQGRRTAPPTAAGSPPFPPPPPLPSCRLGLPLHHKLLNCEFVPSFASFELRPPVRASVTASKPNSLARCWVQFPSFFFVPFHCLHLLSYLFRLRSDGISVSRGFSPSYLIKPSGCRPCRWRAANSNPPDRAPTDSLRQSQANPRLSHRVRAYLDAKKGKKKQNKTYP